MLFQVQYWALMDLYLALMCPREEYVVSCKDWALCILACSSKAPMLHINIHIPFIMPHMLYMTCMTTRQTCDG